MTELPSIPGRRITGWEACRIMLGLRARRMVNALRSGMQALGKRAAPGKRQATPGKARGDWYVPVLFGGIFLLNGFNLSNMMVGNTLAVYGEDALAPISGSLLTILLLTLVAMGIASANRELARLDSDMDWLLSLPISMPRIILAKVIEQAILNVFGWLTVVPYLTVLGWYSGLRWSAPVLALILAVPFLFLAGVLRVVLETALRRACPPSILRNVQAGATLFTMVGMMFVMSPSMVNARGAWFPWGILLGIGNWPMWLPSGLPCLVVRSFALPGGAAAMAFALYAAECTAAIWLAGRALQRLTAAGPVEGRGLLQGKRGIPAGPRPGGGRLRGIIGKELRLLVRDRNFLMSTLIVPVFIVGMQLVFNPRMVEKGFADPRHACAIAFGLGAYVLMFSSANVLSSESRSLWLLYTLPRRLDHLLLEKTFLWAAVSLLYTGSVLAYVAFRFGVDAELLSAAAYAVVGIPLYSVIGGALGVFGCDPLAEDVRQRMRQDYMYLFMTLEGFYVYGFYAEHVWPRFVLIILLVGLALALWQKVRRRMPYLLDPVAAPPARLTLSDGLIAALLFFLLQSLFTVLGTWVLEMPPGPTMLFAFSAAGVLTVVVVLYTLWRYEVRDLRARLGFQRGGSWVRTATLGLLWSVPAILAAFAYLWMLSRWPSLREPAETPSAPGLDVAALRFWFGILAVCAAPLCEETIFRGMIFRGLRESFGVRVSAVASAALFACVHPPVSVAPVFALGLCAALAFEQAGSLLAPILVHALYNSAVLFLQR